MREGLGRAGLYHGGSGGFAGACIACARVLESMEPTVEGRSMQEMLLFGATILPDAGDIYYNDGSFADAFMR